MISLFVYFNMFLIIISAFMVIFSKDPIQSVLFLVVVFMLTALLLFLIGAEFLAILLITVYIGAIAILFLFVVMLLNLRMVELYSSFYYHVPIGAFIGLMFVGVMLFIVNHDTLLSSLLFLLNNSYYNSWNSYVFLVSNLIVIGEALYNYYADLFLGVGLILFSAMLGVIVLTVDYDYRTKKVGLVIDKNLVKRSQFNDMVWENINVLGKRRQYPWWARYQHQQLIIEPKQYLNWVDPLKLYEIPKWVKKVTFGYLDNE